MKEEYEGVADDDSDDEEDEEEDEELQYDLEPVKNQQTSTR